MEAFLGESVAILISGIAVAAAILYRHPTKGSPDSKFQALLAQKSQELEEERAAHAATLRRHEQENAEEITRLEAAEDFEAADVLADKQCDIAVERLRLVHLEDSHGNERS